MPKLSKLKYKEKRQKKIYGKQNYQCKDCHRQFVHESELTYKGCQSSIDDKIRLMLVRGCSIADIAVIERISKYKVLTSDKTQATL